MSAGQPGTPAASGSGLAGWAARHGRALAIGGLSAAVVLGIAFGQVTGSLSDTATGARDPAPGARQAAGAVRAVPPPPSSVPPSSASTTTTTAPPTTTTTPTTTVPTTTTTTPLPPGVTLGPGWRGSAVRHLQERLAELGYWPGPVDGVYRETTRQAVLAFQQAEGLDRRDGVVDAEVGRRLAEASFAWGRSRTGTVVEVDRGRQLLMVVEDGAVRWTLHAATGPLRPGRYAIEREIDGRYEAPSGPIHRPKYFDGTTAIQGTGPVPTPPAPGCACVSDAAMDFLWSTGALTVGTPVLVY
ncbi:MAG TPA: L,D-transpeptidase family protein [Acidimicrobiales bacterium]